MLLKISLVDNGGIYKKLVVAVSSVLMTVTWARPFFLRAR